jgi:hypothetical protein
VGLVSSGTNDLDEGRIFILFWSAVLRRLHGKLFKKLSTTLRTTMTIDDDTKNFTLPPIPTLEQINSDLENFVIDSSDGYDPTNVDVLFETYKSPQDRELSTSNTNLYNQAKQYVLFNLSIEELNSLKSNDNKIENSLRYLNSLRNFISILKNFLTNQK